MSNESNFIPPTIGRVLWFYPAENTAESGFHRKEGGPYAAMIVRVWSDRLVNLVVYDANGNPHCRAGVPLLQHGDDVPAGGAAFCQWMPYQQGQAAKTEALGDALKVAQAAAVDLVALPVVETYQYADTTVVTGVPPLPQHSPAEQDTAPAAGPRIPAEPRTEESHERAANDSRIAELWGVIHKRLQHGDAIPLAFVEELHSRMLPAGEATMVWPRLSKAA